MRELVANEFLPQLQHPAEADWVFHSSSLVSGADLPLFKIGILVADN